MDRKEIKEKAKNMIKGNLWNLLWPVLVIGLVTGLLENLIGPSYNVDFKNFQQLTFTQPTALQSLLTSILGLISSIAGIAYFKYVLKFVRGEEPKFNDIIECIKERWLTIILVELVGGLIIFAFSLLLIVPGIIRALAYAMTGYLAVDTSLDFSEILKKSKEMMNGYKWDYFVFGLSFIGWILLVPFTLGILLVWLMPYMTVSMALYYEKLREVQK